MDAGAALADLTEISSQIEDAVVVDVDGSVLASTAADGGRAERLAAAGGELLAAAAAVGASGRTPTQLEAALREGSVFVVAEGGRRIVATTTPSPTSGLVFYDLKTCLRSLGDEPAKPKPRRRPRKAESADA